MAETMRRNMAEPEAAMCSSQQERLSARPSRGTEQAMTAFRIILIALWLVLAGYTAIVISHHGLGLLPIFFGDMAKVGWPGQFNLDFLCFLILSALWTAWRNRFTSAALLLALVAFFGGAGFLLPYLVFLTARERGNMPRVLIGSRQQQNGIFAKR